MPKLVYSGVYTAARQPLGAKTMTYNLEALNLKRNKDGRLNKASQAKALDALGKALADATLAQVQAFAAQDYNKSNDLYSECDAIRAQLHRVMVNSSTHSYYDESAGIQV